MEFNRRNPSKSETKWKCVQKNLKMTPTSPENGSGHEPQLYLLLRIIVIKYQKNLSTETKVIMGKHAFSQTPTSTPHTILWPCLSVQTNTRSLSLPFNNKLLHVYNFNEIHISYSSSMIQHLYMTYLTSHTTGLSYLVIEQLYKR